MDRLRQLTHALLRIVAGLLILCHGGQKLFGWFGGPGGHTLTTLPQRRLFITLDLRSVRPNPREEIVYRTWAGASSSAKDAARLTDLWALNLTEETARDQSAARKRAEVLFSYLPRTIQDSMKAVRVKDLRRDAKP